MVLWQEAAALHPNPLAALHAHRKVMAVIGIYYCPSIPDVARAYSAFELQCKCADFMFPWGHVMLAWQTGQCWQPLA